MTSNDGLGRSSPSPPSLSPTSSHLRRESRSAGSQGQGRSRGQSGGGGDSMSYVPLFDLPGHEMGP